MCELILVSTGNEKMNKRLAFLLAWEDSESNKDGFGFYNPKDDKIWKTELAARNILNVGEAMSHMSIGTRPLMAHVRASSTYTFGAYKKTNTPEFAHPFMSEKYVLCHNGTLEFREEAKNTEYKGKDMIDSQAFLEVLTENPKPFLEAIKETVDKFYGKFAFLIVDRKDKTQYIVRGKSATLHKAPIMLDGVEIGYVVNTVATDLHNAFRIYKNLYEVDGGKIELGTVEILPEDTVYVATSKFVKKVGTVTEVARPVATAANGYHGRYYPYGAWEDDYSCENITPINLTKMDKAVADAVKFLLENNLTIGELDDLCMEIFCEPLLALDEEMIRFLTEKILPDIARQNYQKMKNRWKELLSREGKSRRLTIVDNRLQFPYLLSSTAQMKAAMYRTAHKKSGNWKDVDETELAEETVDIIPSF